MKAQRAFVSLFTLVAIAIVLLGVGVVGYAAISARNSLPASETNASLSASNPIGTSDATGAPVSAGAAASENATAPQETQRSGAAVASETSAAVSAPIDTSDWNAFSSAEYGFTVLYPPGSVPDSKKFLFSDSVSAAGDESASARLTIETNGKTRECLIVKPDPNGAIKDGTTVINGVTFESPSLTATSSGSVHTTKAYSAVHNGACYILTLTLNAASAPDSQAQADIDHMEAVANAMLHSFAFTPILYDQKTTADLKQYTDTAFGFSFWVPMNWEVQSGQTITYSDGTKSSMLHVGGNAIVIDELTIPNGFVRDEGISGTHGPVTYQYDAAAKEWTVHWDRGAPGTGSRATTTAPVAFNTVGGLPIFTGSSRYSSMFIPLSPTAMLYVSDQGAADSRYLAVTITKAGQQIAPSAQLSAEATEAKEYLGGASTYPN